MRKVIFAVAAMGAMLSAMPAMAQTGKWQIVLGVPDIAMFATTPTGPAEKREVTTIIMLPEAAGGIDNSVSTWTVNCKTKMIVDHGGAAFLNATPAGKLPSSTDDAEATFDTSDDQAALLAIVGNYTCNNTRLSQDTTVLKDDAAARAFGYKLFGR